MRKILILLTIFGIVFRQNRLQNGSMCFCVKNRVGSNRSAAFSINAFAELKAVSARVWGCASIIRRKGMIIWIVKRLVM